MTEYIADILTKNMITDGLIEEHEKSIYYYSIQVLIERIIGFSVTIHSRFADTINRAEL